MIINDTSNGKFYKQSRDNFEEGSDERSVIINEEGKGLSFADQLNNLNENDFEDSLEENTKLPLNQFWMAFGSEAKLWEYSEQAIDLFTSGEPITREQQ